MPPASPVPASATPRSAGRRALRALLWVFGFLAVAAVGAWLARVALVNAALSRFADARVEGVEWRPGGAVVLRGVRFSLPGTPEPLFSADSLTSVASLAELRAGRLGKVTLENPVIRWRPAPEEPAARDKPSVAATSSASGKSSAPSPETLVSWDSLAINGGTLALGEPEKGAFSLKAGVSWTGGAGAVFSDGSVRADTQTVRFTDTTLTLRPASGPLESLRLAASEATLLATLDSAARHLEISDSSLQAASLAVTRRLSTEAGHGKQGASAASSSLREEAEAPSPGWLRSLALRKLAAPDLVSETVPTQGASPAPTLSGKAGGSLSLTDLRWTEDGGLTQADVGAERAFLNVPDSVNASDMTLALGWKEGGALLSRFVAREVELREIMGLLKTFGVTLASPLFPSSLSLKADLSLTDLSLDGEGLRSAAVQEITLRDVKAALPDGSAARFSRARLAAAPDEFSVEGRLRALEIESPEIVWNGGAVSSPDEATTGALPLHPQSAPLPPDAGPAPRPLRVDSLRITGGTARVALPSAHGAVLTTGFRVTDSVESPGNWNAELSGISIGDPEAKETPLYTADSLKVTASPEDLALRKKIRSAEITGSRLEIGEAFFRMMRSGDGASADPPPAADAPENIADPSGEEEEPAGGPAWSLEQLTVADTLVRLDNIGDGRRLEIPIPRQVFAALPLDISALAKVDRVYQVEVPTVTIYSPWREGQKVAVLDSNFVRFSPSGILQRRLDRVELMSPSLYAGQPLFDYVEATRRRFDELTAVPSEEGGGTSPPAAEPVPVAALSQPAAAAAPPETGWEIPFYAESGKVIVAPKGYPWPDIPEFPFRNARGPDGKPIPFMLHGEEFHGELAVAPGWYDFPEMKLRVKLSDRGKIVFNNPVKDRDNNLVEVFENNTVIWRQLRVDKVWLAVTYDKTGIYTRFGGETCGGYISGAVNLYLDELYTWDGSVAFTNIDMKPITDKLTPEYFRMEGDVDALTLKAYGDMNSLYQASGELKVSKPGELEIIALDALREKAAEFAGLSGDLGEIGLDTLRNFDFTSCTGSVKLFGSEGSAELLLKGPEGSRNFKINLRDYRGRQPRSSVRF